MTGKWCGWAAELPIEVKGNVRLAAFVLGDASDPDGLVTYGITKLAARGGMSDRTWQRACDELEAHGWVTKHANAVESIKTRNGGTIILKGNKRPNLYVLHPEPLPESERRVRMADILSRKRNWGDSGDTPSGGDTDDTPAIGGDTGDAPSGDTGDASTPVGGDTGDTQSPLIPTGSPITSPKPQPPQPEADGRLIADPPSDVCGSDRVEKFCQFFHRTCGHQWDLDTEIRTNERRWQKNWYLPAKQLVRDYEGDARRRHLARITLFAFSGHEEAAWYRGKISTPKAFAAHVESLDNRYTALCNAGRDPLVGFQAGQPVMDADQAFAVCLAAHKEATRAGALFIKSLTEAGHPQRLIDSARATKQLFDSARTDDVAAAFRRSWAAWKPAATPEQAA